MTLLEFRTERGLTQQDVADAVGRSKSRISEIEAGFGCSLQTALAIERFTGGCVRPSDLVGDAKAEAAQ